MSKSVVIVDDSAFLVKRIKEFIEIELGLAVLATGRDGNDAVALYRQHTPDLITLDITMPNKDGQEAMRDILAEFPDARILVISALRADAMLECLDMGAKGYVEKPIRFGDRQFMDDFRETVMDALQGEE